MSRDYDPTNPIPFNKIKEIKKDSVWEEITPDTTDEKVCLTNGKDYLWAFNKNGYTAFTRFGLNTCEDILNVLSVMFNTSFLTPIYGGINGNNR